MSITFVKGNLFLSPANTLVNTVNCVGAMGKGIAKEFRYFYPEMFEIYRRQCAEKSVEIGRLHLFRTNHRSILNFPTKVHWRNASRIEYIEAGLQAFRECYTTLGIKSVAFPLLGCSNGGLNWNEQVRPLMEHYLSDLPITVAIHFPESSLPEGWQRKNLKNWLRNEPEHVSFDEFLIDLRTVGAKNDDTLFGDNLPAEQAKEDTESKGMEHQQVEQMELLWSKISDSGLVNSADLAGVPAQTQALLGKSTFLHPVMIGDPTTAPAGELLHGMLFLPARKGSSVKVAEMNIEEVPGCGGNQMP